MNISNLLFNVKMELGIYAVALPLDDVDGTLARVIKETTLRTYSQYFPQYETIRISDTSIEKGIQNIEYADIKLSVPPGQEIVFIEDIYYDASDISGIGYYGAGMPIANPNMIGDLLFTNIGADLTNMAFPKPTFEFFAPNTVRLYHYYGGSMFCKYAKLHNKDLSSIPMSQEETFKNLAIIDCKKALYGIIKHYNELETAHGRINLKIDDWADSMNERKEILKEWDDIFHLERKSTYWA